MEAIDTAAVDQARGIAGDNKAPPEHRRVTVLRAEDWASACAELGRALDWTERRANLLVSGIDLPRAPGARFRIGACVLEITDEVVPCSRMDEASPGLRGALAPDWRGGRCCRVVSPATVAIGDPVELVPAREG
jgi:MOSC domain-containing protein YiiM